MTILRQLVVRKQKEYSDCDVQLAVGLPPLSAGSIIGDISHIVYNTTNNIAYKRALRSIAR